jgi:hypothetical protein
MELHIKTPFDKRYGEIILENNNTKKTAYGTIGTMQVTTSEVNPFNKTKQINRIYLVNSKDIDNYNKGLEVKDFWGYYKLKKQ